MLVCQYDKMAKEKSTVRLLAVPGHQATVE